MRNLKTNLLLVRRILLLIFILLTVQLAARPTMDVGLNSRYLMYALRNLHITRGIDWDADRLEKVKLKFLYELDPEGLFLLESDYAKLKQFTLRPGDFQSISQFVEASALTKRRALQNASSIGNELKQVTLDFNQSDSLEMLDPEDPEHAANREQLKQRWHKYFKASVLERVYLQSDSKDFQAYERALKHSHAQHLRDAVRRQNEKIQETFNHPDGFDDYIASIFLNAMMSELDPHSAFLTEASFKRLQESLSTTRESFGLVMRKSITGELSIVRLIPGGPAYKSGRLHKGDVLLAVRLPDSGNKRIAASDLSMRKLYTMMMDRRTRRIALRVRKANGLITEVFLYKTKIRNDENNVTGFVLDGSQKVGYISLPAFYMDWDSKGGSGCATDVAREIIKLKTAGIKGLILDLRNNGGGITSEAAALAGVFLNYGPIFMQQDRRGQVQIVRDQNRGMLFRGPLLVMVNGQSASASELFVSAMRDYNRAVIVGSQTFGKGSMQGLLPLPRDRGQSNVLKITTDVFYNLKGRSHQGDGLEPDIELPDVTTLLQREGQLPNAYRARPIKQDVFHRPFPEQVLDKLRSRSSNRVGDRDEFGRIEDLVDELEDLLESSTELEVSAHAYFKKRSHFQQVYDQYQQSRHIKQSRFKVRSHSLDMRLESLDAMIRERNQDIRRNIGSDLYIDEAYAIMQDFIPLFKRGKIR